MQKVSSVYKEHANSSSISLLLPPEWFLGFLCVLPEGASRLSVSCQHAGHQLHEVFGLAWGNRKMWNMTGFDIKFRSTECNMTGQSREDRMKKNTSILLKTKKIRKLTAHITKETPAYLSISDLTLRYSQNCLSGGNSSIWKPCQVSFQALFLYKSFRQVTKFTVLTPAVFFPLMLIGPSVLHCAWLCGAAIRVT